MNVRRLRAVGRHIQRHPETYDQDSWCGTACCLAGHAIVKFGSRAQRKRLHMEPLQAFWILCTAARLLDVPHATNLFSSTRGWPRRYRTDNGCVTPELAAKRVEDLIAGREWT